MLDMSMTSERVEGKLITVRTPAMIRRILIWDMDNVGPFGDGLEVLRQEGRSRRGPKAGVMANGEEQSDGRSRRKTNGRRRSETSGPEDTDGG